MDAAWDRLTKDFRPVKSILIGEADVGAAYPWYTWGYSDLAGKYKGALAPHIVDGYKKVPLLNVKLQLQRYDSRQYNQNSKTISFRLRGDICILVNCADLFNKGLHC